ncbi:MAG: hypothetical protein ACI9JN_002554 [Bacteroidia bacterium]|jgi:hypothetical protein
MKPFVNLIIFLIVFVFFWTDVAQAQCSPTLREIYDFEVGDQFFYRQTRRTDDVRSYYSYNHEDYTIVGKYISNDTIRYELLNHENVLDTILIIDSINHPLNQCNGSRYHISSDCIYPDTTKAFAHLSRDSTGRKFKMYGYYGVGQNAEKDSLGYYRFDSDQFIGFNFDCYSIYAEGLGLFARGTFYFERGRNYELQKFIRGKDTLSITLSNPDLITDIESPIIQVYPNPVRNLCTIKSSVGIKSITILDAAGRKQNIIYDSKDAHLLSIRTSSLVIGVYSIQVETEIGVYIKKLLKL